MRAPLADQTEERLLLMCNSFTKLVIFTLQNNLINSLFSFQNDRHYSDIFEIIDQYIVQISLGWQFMRG